MLTLADRVAVMYEGAIVGEVERARATVEQLGLLMAGVRTSSDAAAGAHREASRQRRWLMVAVPLGSLVVAHLAIAVLLAATGHPPGRRRSATCSTPPTSPTAL